MFAAVLLSVAMTLLISCTGAPKRSLPQPSPSDDMTAVVTTATIDGAADAIFDLVTTARFWPRWHPATRAVAGVTERPFQLGDRIEEAGQIGALKFQTSWKVVEHERPARAVLQSETSNTRIIYTFRAAAGVTVFTRELNYDLDRFAAVAASRESAAALMRSQSEQAVQQLKAMVEKILHEEKTGIR